MTIFSHKAFFMACTNYMIFYGAFAWIFKKRHIYKSFFSMLLQYDSSKSSLCVLQGRHSQLERGESE